MHKVRKSKECPHETQHSSICTTHLSRSCPWVGPQRHLRQTPGPDVSGIQGLARMVPASPACRLIFLLLDSASHPRKGRGLQGSQTPCRQVWGQFTSSGQARVFHPWVFFFHSRVPSACVRPVCPPPWVLRAPSQAGRGVEPPSPWEGEADAGVEAGRP